MVRVPYTQYTLYRIRYTAYNTHGTGGHRVYGSCPAAHLGQLLAAAVLITHRQLRGRLGLLDDHHPQAGAGQALSIRVVVGLRKAGVRLVALLRPGNASLRLTMPHYASLCLTCKIL